MKEAIILLLRYVEFDAIQKVYFDWDKNKNII